MFSSLSHVLLELLLSGAAPGGLSSAFSFPGSLYLTSVCLLCCFSYIMELLEFF